MPYALITLLRLNFLGVFRRMARSARTVRGIVFVLLGILAFVGWLGPSLFTAMRSRQANPQVIQTIAPFAILGFCLSNLFASLGEKAVAFSAAEVDFLFPGPFTRRSLLLYKIAKTGLGTLFTTIVFTAMLLRYGGSFIACFLGVWLTIQFMQLFSMMVVMIGQTVGEQLYSGGRRIIAIALAAVVICFIAPSIAGHFGDRPMQIMQRLHATTAGRILLAPFDVFARLITARVGTRDLAIYAPLGALIDLVMLGIVVGLDANYLETATVASQKRYDRLQRMRSGGGAFRASTPGAMRRLRLPSPPWFCGAGPIAWRQMTTALRSTRSLFLILGIIGVIAALILGQRRAGDESGATLVGTVVWLNVVFISMLKFDFRDELDRLDLLRSLPIRPIAVALGEVMTPVVVLTAMQVAMLVLIGFVTKADWKIGLAALAFAIPFNLLLAGIENLLFLMFPVRAVGLIAGDMQLFGRQMVVFLCKFLLLVICCGIAAAFGTVGYIFGNRSWIGFAIVAWPALCCVALATIPLIARAFSKFDPSVDTPT
jgi:hypothetical protein